MTKQSHRPWAIALLALLLPLGSCMTTGSGRHVGAPENIEDKAGSKESANATPASPTLPQAPGPAQPATGAKPRIEPPPPPSLDEQLAFVRRSSVPAAPFTDADRQFVDQLPPSPAPGSVAEAALTLGLVKTLLNPPGGEVPTFQEQDLTKPAVSPPGSANQANVRQPSLERSCREHGINLPDALSENPLLGTAGAAKQVALALDVGENSAEFKTEVLSALRRQAGAWSEVSSSMPSGPGSTQAQAGRTPPPNAPGAASPGAGTLDLNAPGTPNAAGPGAATANVPGAGVPTTAGPGAATADVPGAGVPTTAGPGAATANVPGAGVPNAAAPGAATASVPGTGVPTTAGPGAATASVPGTGALNAAAQGAATASAPGAGAPNMAGPGAASVPEAGVPTTAVPGAATASIPGAATAPGPSALTATGAASSPAAAVAVGPPNLAETSGGDNTLANAQSIADQGDYAAAIKRLQAVPDSSPFKAQAQEKIKEFSNLGVQELRKKAALAFQTAMPVSDPRTRAGYLKQAKTYLEEAVSKYPDAPQLTTVKDNLRVISHDLESLDAEVVGGKNQGE